MGDCKGVLEGPWKSLEIYKCQMIYIYIYVCVYTDVHTIKKQHLSKWKPLLQTKKKTNTKKHFGLN